MTPFSTSSSSLEQEFKTYLDDNGFSKKLVLWTMNQKKLTAQQVFKFSSWVGKTTGDLAFSHYSKGGKLKENAPTIDAFVALLKTSTDMTPEFAQLLNKWHRESVSQETVDF
ncbi:MAG: hypothetical protein LBI11_03770 [Streptococcaceae bacterium]|jgi:hypothetical protein|nr:hypothetical protein [Streptococcaceae bacterium]